MAIRYRIVEGKDTEGLEQDVNECLRDGWDLQGGVCAVNSQANTYAWWFYQALVRDDADRSRDEDG